MPFHTMENITTINLQYTGMMSDGQFELFASYLFTNTMAKFIY